jgi:hypothetical protein
MPQYLTIEIGGVCIAKMKTSHLDGTHYNIFWNSKIGYEEDFPNFDTGVECQPSDPVERKKDFKNDFIHARRVIAAASLTAKQFLDNFINKDKSIKDEFGVVHIILRTNEYDRGRITLSPSKDLTAKLTMEIGTGPERPQGAKPIKTKKFIKESINLIGDEPSISMVGQVLESEGLWMLKTLGENT